MNTEAITLMQNIPAKEFGNIAGMQCPKTSAVEYEWQFSKKNFDTAQKSKEEDNIFGWIGVKTSVRNYVVDIHKYYYNSKDCGFDLEIYTEAKNGGHGNWLAGLQDIKSVTAKVDPLKRFKKRAEKIITAYITDYENKERR